MATQNQFKNQVAQKKENNNQPQQKAVGPKQEISNLLDRMAPQIQKALPQHMSAERMARIAMTAVSSTPKLLECDPKSLIGALMQSSQIGLEPNTNLGQAYLIPYGKEVQLQVSYLGMIELANRSKQYKAIYAHEVYPEDYFEYQYGLQKDLVHKPADNPQSEPIGYYAVYHLLNGGYDFAYWSKAKVDEHAKQFSKAVQKGWQSPWKTNFNAMAKKTVLKDLLKFAPKSIEMNNAVSSDSKAQQIDDDGNIIDVTDYSQINDEPENLQEGKNA